MLYSLLDGRARTSTELAVVGGVTPSTASVHLQRLNAQRLVKVVAQGKHRYYTLDRPEVAAALEALNVVAGGGAFAPTTPHALRAARSCYDHVAGTLGVALFDASVARGWRRRSRRSVSTWPRRGRPGADSPSRVSTGVNAARISAVRLARRC